MLQHFKRRNDQAADSMMVEAPASPTRGIQSFIGSSGNDLDGQSLLLPAEGDFADEISSINTSNYDAPSPARNGYGEKLTIVGTVENEPQHLAVGVMALDTSRGEKEPNLEKDTLPDSPGSESPECQADDEDDGGGCTPSWISDAPCWLKFVIITTTALLVGAIVLIAVAFALSHLDKNKSNSAPNPSSGMYVPTLAPTASPVFNVTNQSPTATLRTFGP